MFELWFAGLLGLPIAGGAAYAAALACRIARRRQWKVGWHICLIAAGLSGVVAFGVCYLGFALQHGVWGKFDLRPFINLVCASGTVLGVVSSGLVVHHYRIQLTDGNGPA